MLHGSERILHRVARGETVLSIANLYGVSAKSIRKWNGLRSNKVPVGKRLILHVYGGYRTANAKTQTTSKQTSSKSQKTKPVTNNTKSQATVAHYKVRPGDSFYTIAQRFPGYSHTDLMKLNNMTHSALKAGQYILVPKI